MSDLAFYLFFIALSHKATYPSQSDQAQR